MTEAESRADMFARFMSKVTVPSRKSDCWIWQATTARGYGQFSTGMSSKKAHRWIYEVVVGPIPDGHIIRHRCDTPRCVNPKHLEVGTDADNARDRSERGRGDDRKGERHPQARLTESDVREIRRLAHMGNTQSLIAKRFGVVRGQVQKIVSRKNWSHVQ